MTLLQAPYGAKLLRFICDKVHRFNRKHDKTKYPRLLNFDEKHKIIFDRASYLIMLESNISDISYHNYVKIKIISDEDYLPLEKTINVHNVVKLVKSAFNKNHYHYYYQRFLEKWLYK